MLANDSKCNTNNNTPYSFYNTFYYNLSREAANNLYALISHILNSAIALGSK